MLPNSSSLCFCSTKTIEERTCCGACGASSSSSCDQSIAPIGTFTKNLSPSPNPHPRRLAMASTKIGLHLGFYVCVFVCVCRPSCSGGLQHNWSENSPMMTTISVASMYVSILSWLNFNVLLASPCQSISTSTLLSHAKKIWQKEQQNKGPTSMTEVKYFPAIYQVHVQT